MRKEERSVNMDHSLSLSLSLPSPFSKSYSCHLKKSYLHAIWIKRDEGWGSKLKIGGWAEIPPVLQSKFSFLANLFIEKNAS
jgi:hypothetical protein